MRKLTLLISMLFLSLGMTWAQQIPLTDGAIVTITNVQKDSKEYALHINNGTLSVGGANVTAATLGDAAKFKAIQKDGKWAFYNESTGLYLIWRGNTSGGYNSNAGTLGEYNSTYCDWSINQGSVADTYYIVSKRSNGTTDGSLIVLASGAFDAYSANEGYTDNFSNLFRIDFVEEDITATLIDSESGVEFGGTYRGFRGQTKPTLPWNNVVVSEEWNGNKYNATITLPLLVNKKKMIAIHEPEAAHKWYVNADNKNVRVDKEPFDFSNIDAWVWKLHPVMTGNVVTLTIEHVATGKYVKVNTESNQQHDTENTVIIADADEATAFEMVECSRHSGITSLKVFGRGAYLSINSDRDENVNLGVWNSSHLGTRIHLTDLPDPVAKIGETNYYTFAEALEATKAMTGDVTVEIYEKVTLNQPLTGSYSSIKFVGNGENAEIYLDVQGYVEAAGKKVAFEDLKLSKVDGGYISNAGFMNLAFGVYGVTEAAYTNCTFLNGAYASTGDVTFAGCTFYRSHDRYGLWAYGNVNVTVDGCTFADIRGIKMYAEGQGQEGAAALTVKNTDFSAANGKPAIVLTYGESVTLENNTYNTDKGVFELDLDGAPNGVAVTSDVAPTCVNDNGACGVLVDGKIYTTVAQAAAVATNGSNVTLLHSSAETVEFAYGVIVEKNGFTADNVTVEQPLAAYVVLPEGMNQSNYKTLFGANTVTDGANYYATLQAAVEAVAGQANAVLYCKPGAESGNMQHAPVVSTLTVYGNGASVTGFEHFDLGNTDKNENSGLAITADMTLTIKNLNGFSVWGAKSTAHGVNVVIEECDDMGKVFITGTTGTLNIAIEDSEFKGREKEAVYSNADGAITLNNVAFSNLNKAVNLNHKAAGTQNVTINGCSFTNCGNNVAADQIPVRVVSSVEGGKSVLSVSNSTFSGTPDGGADVLLDYGVGLTEATVASTTANVVVENENNVGTKTEVSEGNSYEFTTAKPVASINGTTYMTLEEAVAAAKSGDEIVMLADATLAEALTLPAGITLNGNGKQINGTIVAAGDITFAGVTKAGDLDFAVGNTVVNIPAGASLQLNGSARMSIGFGTTFNIVGTIEDAKTADKATVVPSLVIPGASFSGAGVKFNVTNAYISVPSSYCSTSKSASGTFDFNITNSIWESAGKLAFEEQSVNAKVDFALVNSVLTTGSHLVFGTASGEEGVVIDNSYVNKDTSRQLENCGTMTIKNGSVVNGAVATSSNAKNPGTVIVENATYAVTGEFSGSDLGTGTLNIKKGATVSAGSITKANIVIDAAEMTAGDEINLTANLAKFAGTLSVINNDKLEAKIVDGKVVLAAKPVAKIGEQGYATLQDAINAVENGETIKVLNSFAIDSETFTVAKGKNVTLDLSGCKITVTDNKAGNNTQANYELFYILGEMTVTGNGTIELTATNNREWNASSSIFHNRGGVLNIENGTFKHLGGTDMAYVIDNSGNWAPDATTNVKGGEIASSYIGIRNRMDKSDNSGKAILNVSGGKISGTKRAIWAQASSSSEAAPAKGEINVSGGEVGLIETARNATAQSMTTVTGGTVDAFKGEAGELKVTTGGTVATVTIYDAAGNEIAYVVNSDGLYVAVTDVAASGTWGGIDWSLTYDGTLTIAPTKGTPTTDNSGKWSYEVGQWPEAVKYNNKGVGVDVGLWPYDRTKVKTLIIEEGVTSIGSFTAQNFTNLTGEVVIPYTVKYIGQEAFQKSTMTKLTFAPVPEGKTGEELCIAQGALKNLVIEEITFPEDRPVHLHAWMFANSNNLKHVTLPATIKSINGTTHVDYNHNPNQTTGGGANTSDILGKCPAVETITFGSQEVRDLYYNPGWTRTDAPIVVNVGLKSYKDFRAGIDAAKDGETVTLLGNVTLEDTWTIPAGMNLTLNLNGKTLSQSKACTASYEMINNKGNLNIVGSGKISFTDTSAGDPNFGWGSYTVRNEGNLVVEKATIEHKGAQAFGTHCIMAIYQYCGSTTIDGGTISTPNYRSARLWKGDMTINGGTFDGQLWVQAVDNTANLVINGGTFEPNGGEASAVFVTNSDHDVQLAVADGTFKGKIGCSDATKLAGCISDGSFNEAAKNGTNTALLATGFVFSSQMVDGYYAVSPETDFVATVGGVGYMTFADAYNAAQAGDVINLFADIEATEVILLGKSLTINGNGHKVTSNATRVFRVTAADTEVTLNDVNMVNTAVRVGTNDIRGISVDDVTGVKLTLNNCSVDFTDATACDWSYAVNVVGGSGHVVTVNGGTYEGANVINVRGANQRVTVKDAVLTSLYPNNDVYYGACIYVVQNASSSVEATGNTFNGSNAIAFNVGYTSVTESDNTDNTQRVVAKVGDAYYATVTEAINAAADGATVKLIAGTIDEYIAPWAADSQHASEKSITIVGAADYATTLTGGIYLGYDDNGCREHTITIEGINFTGKGILVAGQQNVVIKDNKFSDITAVVATSQSANANAISVIGKSINATVTGNVIENTASAGINLRDVANATVSGNTISGTENNSITITETAGDGAINVNGNILADWGRSGEGRAIRVAAAKAVTANGNVMSHDAAPEELAKVTKATSLKAVGNYWNGESPEDEEIFNTDVEATLAEMFEYYYTDMEMTQRVDFDPNYLKKYVINDSEQVVYTHTEDMFVGKLTYQRTLAMGAWNPLFVPFEISIDELAENYEIAYYNQMLSYDKDNDGEFDDYNMEIAKLTSGTVRANYPLFIRPKSESARNLVYEAEDVTLYVAEEYSLLTSSASNKFELSATHLGKDLSELDGCLTLGMNGWTTPGASLKPGRMYLKISSNSNSPFAPSTSRVKSAGIVVRGEDGTTEIEGVEVEQTDAVIYDLAGRRVLEAVKGGIYIVNGKKVLVK